MKKIVHRPNAAAAAAVSSTAGLLLLAAAITGGNGGRPAYAAAQEPVLLPAAAPPAPPLTPLAALGGHVDFPFAHGQHPAMEFFQEPDDVTARVYFADAFGAGSEMEGKTEAEYLKERLAAREQKRKEYAAKLDEYRKKSDKELPNKERVIASYERGLKTYDEYIERLRKMIPEAEKRAPLQKAVDVKFQSATVQQAAEALSKASGVPIRVDSGVPDTTRLTVEAKRIRLATVLEGIAQQAGLIIEPDKSAPGVAVLLTTGPSLSISVEGADGANKGRIEQRAPRRPTPWSAEWGTPPTRRIYLYGPSDALLEMDFLNMGSEAVTQALERAGRALSNITIAPPAVSIPTPPPAVFRQGGAFGGSFGGSLSSSFGSSGGTVSVNGKTIRVGSGASIASPSPDTIVVSEPGTNDKGEKGYFLTVYKIEKDGKLNKASTTFHATASKYKDDKKDGQNGGGATATTVTTI